LEVFVLQSDYELIIGRLTIKNYGLTKKLPSFCEEEEEDESVRQRFIEMINNVFHRQHLQLGKTDSAIEIKLKIITFSKHLTRLKVKVRKVNVPVQYR
jgi:hypothetical protein